MIGQAEPAAGSREFSHVLLHPPRLCLRRGSIVGSLSKSEIYELCEPRRWAKKRRKARKKGKQIGPHPWHDPNDPTIYFVLRYHYRRRSKGDIDAQFLAHLWEAQRGRCCYCECELDLENRVLEHMKPIARGGTNNKNNVAWACWDCNTRKGARTYKKFIAAEMGRVEALWHLDREEELPGGTRQSSNPDRKAEGLPADQPRDL